MNDWSARCTIGITTRDRVGDLRHTIERQKTIGFGDMRYIIVDDGSADGEALRTIAAELPHCRFLRHEQSAGYVQRRHEMAEMCETEFLISLDDDSYFVDVGGMEHVMQAFDQNRQLGLVSFKIVELRLHESPVQRRITQFPEGHLYWFRGCGYLVRVTSFLAAGGYPTAYQFGAEESHLLHQFFRLGIRVLHLPSVAVEHRWSPRARPHGQRAYHLYRSQVLVKMLNWPFLPMLAGLAKMTFWNSWGTHEPFHVRFRGALSGMRMGVRERGRTQQLSWHQHRAFQRELQRGAVPERVEVEGKAALQLFA